MSVGVLWTHALWNWGVCPSPNILPQKPWVRKRDVCVLVAQWCLTLCNPKDCIPSGFSVHVVLQARLSFLDSSVCKESAYNAGDRGSIPGSGRSTGERIGYPLQYSWASLVAQLVKNPPAMWEIWVQSLDWEDPLEKGKATHSSILA